MPNVKVNLSCSVVCDECGHKFDPLDTPGNSDGDISEAILDSKTPNCCVEFSVVCPNCSVDLDVKGVTWI